MRWSGLTPGHGYTLEAGIAGAFNPTVLTMPAQGDLPRWAVRDKGTRPGPTPFTTRMARIIALVAGVGVLLLGGGAWLTGRRRR